MKIGKERPERITVPAPQEPRREPVPQEPVKEPEKVPAK